MGTVGELPHGPARWSCTSGPKSSGAGLAAFNGAATVVLVLLGVWEVQEARACRICACSRSVYVLEAPLARVHPYVACISVELYFLALSVCRIDQQPVMCMWDRIFQSSVTGSEVRSCTWSNEHLKSG